MAGTYTEIVKITAPASASPGDLVTVEVKVRNLYGDWLPIAVGGWLDSGVTAIWFIPEYKWFEPGDVYPFTYSFIMPNNAVTIYVWSYYGPNGDFVDDDFGYVNIALVAPITGEIVSVWMWYEGADWETVWALPGIPGVIPGEIPLNSGIYLAPTWRNTSEVNIVGHVDLSVTYPDGTMASLSAISGQDTERSPGQQANVMFEPFTASQTGTYTVVATLSSAGQVLDTVTFELVAAAVAEYEGTLSRKELEYDETWASIPVSNIPQNDRGILHIWGRNDTAITQRMGIYWFVADPDGLVVQEYSNWELWPYTSPGGEHGFLAGRFDLDKVGKYTTWIELLMNPDDPQVVDRYIGDLCTVQAVVPEYRGTISRKELEYDDVRSSIPVY